MCKYGNLIDSILPNDDGQVNVKSELDIGGRETC